VPAITNLDAIEKFLKLKDFKNCKFGRQVRIAVLDNSFFGYQTEVGKRLPAGTQYFPGVTSDADRFEDKSMHGLFMAILIHQIVLKSIIMDGRRRRWLRGPVAMSTAIARPWYKYATSIPPSGLCCSTAVRFRSFTPAAW